jgi:nicotinate (nicotinamide) nucleotide adenylyltransferase
MSLTEMLPLLSLNQNGSPNLKPVLKICFGNETQPNLNADLQRLQTQWDANATVWNQVTEQGLDAFRNEMLDPAVLSLLKPTAGQVLLDAGCGNGYFTQKLARLNAKEVIGVDLSPNLIASANQLKTKSASSSSLRFETGSITDLSNIPDQSVDQITCTMTLMDCPDLEAVLKTFNRVLKPGGNLVFSIKHPFTTLKGIQYKVDESGRLQMSADTGYFDTIAFSKTVMFEAPKGSNANPTITSIHYPRTVSNYLQALSQNGFGNLTSLEPAPSDAQCAERPYLKPFQRIPFAWVVRAEKIGDSLATKSLPIQFGKRLENVTLTPFQKSHFYYGVTGDPYHLGHHMIALAAQQQFNPTPLTILPSAVPPHKQRSNMVAFEHRANMLESVFKNRTGFTVSRIEETLPQPNFTVNTLRALIPGFDTLSQKSEKAVMLIGADSLATLHKWKEAAVLAKNVLFVVAPRDENEIPDPPKNEANIDFDWTPLKLVPWNLSSTSLRKMVYEKAPWTDLIRYMPESVVKYIRQFNFYNTPDAPPANQPA